MRRTPDALQDGVFDLLILGGGITGAGVALDAVLRGYRTALIDKGDFASGTSSASSKLVHGGLRYLEHGEFHLVYEALQERGRLLRNAPHLVHPLRFILPCYRGARVPLWKWRLGLTLYDLLAGRRNIRRSRPLRAGELRYDWPHLRAEGLIGGAAYYDAQMDDARLCIEVLQSAAAEGAVLCNYVEAVAFERADGQIAGVRAIDHVGGDEFTIRARVVLNATGPWLDRVCQLAGDTSGPHLSTTKGVHVVAENPGLTDAFLLLHPDDGRVFFVIPWMNHPCPAGQLPEGKLLIGTTDTHFQGTPDDLTATPGEIAYLLRAYNHYFRPTLGETDLRGSFAGLRPLIRARSGTPSSLTREFQVFTSPSGLISVAGGKYTTYRHMAEVITDAVGKRLGRHRSCKTGEYRLHGTPSSPWPSFRKSTMTALRDRHQLPEVAAMHLLDRYGRNAVEVASYLDGHPDLAGRVLEGEPDLRVEFRYQREREMALYPSDFLLRRTRLGLFQPDLLKHPPPDLEGSVSGKE